MEWNGYMYAASGSNLMDDIPELQKGCSLSVRLILSFLTWGRFQVHCWLCSCRDVVPFHFLFQRWDVNFVCCRWGHSQTLQSCCCSKILFPFSLGETSMKRSIKEEGMSTACAGYTLRVHLSTLVLSSSYLFFVLFCFFEAGLIIQCT